MDVRKRLGRPRDLSKAKHRTHSIILTEKAERIFQHIVMKRGKGWFSSWISHMLCEEFPMDDEEKFWLKEHLRRNKVMLESELHWKEAVDKFTELKRKRLEKENETPI